MDDDDSDPGISGVCVLAGRHLKRTFSSDDLIKACQSCGWVFDRQEGSHAVYVKADAPRPIVIQQGKKELPQFIVSVVRKQLGLTKAELDRLV